MQGAAAVGPRLSAMMFIQFFIWGAWYVTVGNYMGEIGMSEQIWMAYTVGSVAAIISPFFMGLVADRFFNAERVLGILHIVGGIAIFAAPMVAGSTNSDGTANWLPFIGLLQLHMLCYMPTIGLTNTLGLKNLSNAEKQFPLIRVFGTIGWIVAGVVVSKWLGADTTALPLQIAGGAGIAMGIYSFTLPPTPPVKGPAPKVAEIIGLDALRQMSSLSFWVFIIASMLICIPLSAYYAYAPVFVGQSGIENPAFKMTFGQMSEIFFMLVMPLCFARLGAKWMLAIGMLAWVVRYGLFAEAAIDGTLWMILGGIILHGICYDFFFVTGYIYADNKAPEAVRGQAQGFLVLVTLGIGMLVGGIVAGQVFNGIVTGKEGAELGDAWRSFWWIPAIFAGVIMVLFILLFKDDGKRRQPEAIGASDLADGAAAEPMP